MQIAAVSKKKSIVLYGSGSLALEIAAYLRDVNGDGAISVSDIVSNDSPRMDALTEVLGLEPCWHRDLASVSEIGAKRLLLCIGDAAGRHRLLDEAKDVGVALTTLIHPKAYVDDTAVIGEGSIVAPFAFVGPFAQVGRNCLVNVHAVVGCEAVLGDSTVLSAGAITNGHVRTGVAAFLGPGAVIYPRVELGRFSELSAGSVLSHSVGSGLLMHGNPAKKRQMIKAHNISDEEEREERRN